MNCNQNCISSFLLVEFFLLLPFSIYFMHYMLKAHNYVRSLRRTIQVLARTSTPSIELIREKIGHALYTLQEFYSNTNWVETHGDTVYEEFGMGLFLFFSS